MCPCRSQPAPPPHRLPRAATHGIHCQAGGLATRPPPSPTPCQARFVVRAGSGATRVSASSPHVVAVAGAHSLGDQCSSLSLPLGPPPGSSPSTALSLPPPPNGIIGAAALGVMKRGTPPSAASSDDEGPRSAADGGRVAALNAALDGDAAGTATASTESGGEDDLSGVPPEVIAAAAEREGAARAALDAVLAVRDWSAETDVDSCRPHVHPARCRRGAWDPSPDNAARARETRSDARRRGDRAAAGEQHGRGRRPSTGQDGEGMRRALRTGHGGWRWVAAREVRGAAALGLRAAAAAAAHASTATS